MKTVNVMFDAGTSELLGVSHSTPRKHPYITVPISDLEEYPLACWELSEDQAEIVLKADAGAIKGSILVPAEDSVPTVDLKVSPVEFKLLWRPEERIKLSELREVDKGLEDFFSILDDPRLTEVRLGQPSVLRGLDHSLSVLLTAGVIADQAAADQRKADILAGIAQ